MLVQTLTKRLNGHKLALLALVLVGVVLAMIGTLFMRLEYETTSRFIIIQEQRFSDAFTQSKSTEYVSGILARVVSTDSFREAVFSKYDYLSVLFPQDRDELRKEWNGAIGVVPLKDTGIISITAYNVERTAAESLVFAVGDTLTNNIKTYLGNGAAIELRPIDGPITSEYPARPSFTNNALAGALIGAMLGIVVFGLREGSGNRVARAGDSGGGPVAPVPPVPVKLSTPVPTRSTRKSDANKKARQVKPASFSQKEFEQWIKQPSRA